MFETTTEFYFDSSGLIAYDLIWHVKGNCDAWPFPPKKNAGCITSSMMFIDFQWSVIRQPFYSHISMKASNSCGFYKSWRWNQKKITQGNTVAKRVTYSREKTIRLPTLAQVLCHCKLSFSNYELNYTELYSHKSWRHFFSAHLSHEKNKPRILSIILVD